MLRKKPEVEEPKLSRELSLGEVESFYGSRLSSKISQAELSSKQLQEELSSLFTTLPTAALEKAKFNPNDRTYAAVNMAKDSYVARVKAVKNASPQPSNGYTSILDFKKSCTKSLDELKNASPKQSMSVSNYFSKESTPLVAHIKKISEALSRLESFLSSEGKPLEFMSSLSGLKEEHSSLSKRLGELSEKDQSLVNEAASRESELKKEKEALASLLSSNEWEELDALQEQVSKLENNIFTKEHAITGELSPLKRPLKKAKHALGKQPFVDNFISSPLKAFMSESGEQALGNILALIQGLLKEKKMTIKSSEKEKLDQLQERLESGGLGKLKTEHSTLLRQKDSATSALKTSTLPAKKQVMESSITFLETRLAESKKEASLATRQKASAQQEIEAKKKEIQELITKHTGDTITLT